MAITTLDPKTALFVIDLQKGIVGVPTVHPSAEVVKRAAALAEAHANIARVFPRFSETATALERLAFDARGSVFQSTARFLSIIWV